MKKAIVSAVLALSAVALCSCGAPRYGLVYTDVSKPLMATTATGSKVGTATSTNYLSLYATGDASIDAAKKNGGITTVSSVDEKVHSTYGGLITTYTTTVRGE